LRIADSFGEHLAKLSLRLHRLAREGLTSRPSKRLAHYETCSASTVSKFGLVVPLGVSDLSSWIFRFIIAEALKTTARCGKIGASTPVFGFRPMRWPFSRTVNDPNDDNFTISHRAMVSTISFKTRSTKADDSVRVKPSFVR
jgi:hypothetical protein